MNNITLAGNFSITGWNRAKPYAAVLLQTTAGVVSLTSFGYQTITTSSVSRAGTNSKAYQITFHTAHPLGINFAVIAMPYTPGSLSWGAGRTTSS